MPELAQLGVHLLFNIFVGGPKICLDGRTLIVVAPCSKLMVQLSGQPEFALFPQTDIARHPA